MEISSNRTIFKNTILLYFRLALVTVVGLYASRVILQTLGVDDFGIYNVAGSAVALFTFLSGALGQSSSRYITVEIGKVKNDDINDLLRCFKTTRTIHGILAIIIGIVCETLGLWILHKSSIPADRQMAAFWVFQISTVTAMINVTQIPFNALIIAHERMGVFAVASIFESLAKLGVCFMLIISPIDKLIYYAILLFVVQLSVFLFYRIYCTKKFAECKLGYRLDKDFFKPILSFSFWSLFGGLAYSALTQGTTILVSFFFSPAIVAARSIANQVKGHVTVFVTNFRTAINPQIIKRHAAGEIESSKELLFLSTNVTFYLMLVFVLPLVFESRFVLELWLADVPEYTVEFTQIALLEMLFYVYDVTFFQIFQATGRLKENALICPLVDFVGLAVVYIMYIMGAGVLVIAWCMVILTMLEGMLIKPFLAVKLFGYSWKEFFVVFVNNIKVCICAIVLPLAIYLLFEKTVLNNCIVIMISVISVLLSSFFIGLNNSERIKVKELIITKIRNKK